MDSASAAHFALNAEMMVAGQQLVPVAQGEPCSSTLARSSNESPPLLETASMAPSKSYPSVKKTLMKRYRKYPCVSLMLMHFGLLDG